MQPVQQVTHIYALLDPRTMECRYVGKADDVQKRLRGHLHPSHLKYKWHKVQWLLQLKDAGLIPDIEILEVVTKDTWIEAEVWWIAYMKYLGANLTNKTLGGDGVILDVYPKLSPERCTALSKMNSGANHPQYGKHRSAETKAKLSKSHSGPLNHNYGKPFSAERKEKIGAAQRGEKSWRYGMKMTSEEIAHRSNKIRGQKRSYATKEKLSSAKLGALNPMFGTKISEETRLKRSIALKAAWARIKESRKDNP